LLLDAKTNNPIETNSIERIDFAGRDWIKVVDFLKQKPVKAANGMLTVGLKLNDNDQEPSPSNPYFYTVIVTITNCLPVVIPIRVDEKTYETRNKVVRVINKLDPPDCIIVKKTSFSSKEGNSIGVGSTSISIPSNLVFRDIKGSIIPTTPESQVTTSFVGLDLNNPYAQYLFPGGVVTTMGKDNSVGVFSPLSCTYVGFSLSAGDVSTFAPITVAQNTNTNVIGDWGVWNFDDQGSWVQKNKTSIPNASTTTVKVDSLSWWTVGKLTPGDTCKTKISLIGFAEGINLWCEIYNAATNQLVADGFSISIKADGTAIKEVRNLPSMTNLKARVYNNPFDVSATTIITETVSFLTCNPITIDGKGYGKDTTQFTPFTMDVKLQCSKGVVNILIEPDMPIYMRATGDVRWTYMGYMEKGKLLSRAMKLTIGKQYDMMTPAFSELLWKGEALKSYGIEINWNNCP
jgi:hypothetical protein